MTTFAHKLIAMLRGGKRKKMTKAEAVEVFERANRTARVQGRHSGQSFNRAMYRQRCEAEGVIMSNSTWQAWLAYRDLSEEQRANMTFREFVQAIDRVRKDMFNRLGKAL